jgi:hypothetical protein
MKLRIIALTAVLAVGFAAYFILSREEPQPPPEPRPFVWDFEMDELSRIAISLPREELSEAWVKHEDKYWYFDQPGGPKVDMSRWGGGVPLLMSGPGAERLVVPEATSEQLEAYGFAPATLRIEVTVASGQTIGAEVGDATPDSRAYYIKRTDSPTVFIVDRTWYEVLDGLVRNPPYPNPSS